MTRDTHPGSEEPPSAADLARYAAAAAAVADPERVLGPASVAFRTLYEAVRAGDGSAARAASLAVQDHCLQLCAAPATSARAADDKVRFLTIIIGWAWPRAPAVAAVLEASCAQELARWGPSAQSSG